MKFNGKYNNLSVDFESMFYLETNYFRTGKTFCFNLYFFNKIELKQAI